MKVVSFNVNSIRLRLHQITAIIEQHQPDVIALQETKVDDPDFPAEDVQALGYDVVFHGQKTHYGVALMTRIECTNVGRGFPGESSDAQKRLIRADVRSSGGELVSIINGYFPQGEKRSHPVKFPAKQKFYADLHHLLQHEYDPAQLVLIVGDFNVAPVDNDIGIGADNARRWLREGSASFLPEEREWLQRLMDWGLVDTYRHKYPDVDNLFSWFDYRSRGFDREPRRGLRIDHLMATHPLAERLIDSGINYDIRAMEKPSDHCPAWSCFDV